MRSRTDCGDASGGLMSVRHIDPPLDASRVAAVSVYPAAPMARDWTDLFLTDGPVPAAAAAEEASPEHRRGFFRRLRENMRKTREALAAEVQATLFEGDLDEATWERL